MFRFRATSRQRAQLRGGIFSGYGGLQLSVPAAGWAAELTVAHANVAPYYVQLLSGLHGAIVDCRYSLTDDAADDAADGVRYFVHQGFFMGQPSQTNVIDTDLLVRVPKLNTSASPFSFTQDDALNTFNGRDLHNFRQAGKSTANDWFKAFSAALTRVSTNHKIRSELRLKIRSSFDEPFLHTTGWVRNGDYLTVKDVGHPGMSGCCAFTDDRKEIFLGLYQARLSSRDRPNRYAKIQEAMRAFQSKPAYIVDDNKLILWHNGITTKQRNLPPIFDDRKSASVLNGILKNLTQITKKHNLPPRRKLSKSSKKPPMKEPTLSDVIREIGTRMDKMEIELRNEIGDLRSEMRSEMGELRSEMGELRSEMGELRNDVSAVNASLEDQVSRKCRIQRAPMIIRALSKEDDWIELKKGDSVVVKVVNGAKGGQEAHGTHCGRDGKVKRDLPRVVLRDCKGLRVHAFDSLLDLKR